MSSHDSYYTNPTSPPSGPPPPPPPKPYAQDPSRTATPIASPPPQQQNRHSQQPPLPPHPSQAQSPPPQPQPQYQAHPSQQQQYHPQPQPQPHSHAQQPTNPTLPQTFDLPDSITKHTTPDLSSLLSNPETLTALAQQHPSYAASLQPLQTQISSNIALSQQVSSLETQVRQLREQTTQLMLQHTSLQTQWRRKQSEMDEALAPWGPRAMYQRLVAGISEQEALLRAVHESFLEGGGDQDYYGGGGAGASGKASEKEITDWVRRIREGTTVLEKRREMRARWDEGRVGGWR
ncbi:hypothetical protein PMZ80_000556 [Knufia obscura]|uniref:VPS37 C-terminal domain-containing protein n=1 Tax=Knufia obscura TaxID=1635080 RepID=A0ABR0S1Q5_9EURO|nr:hypothetical protein PMZ80_000556 [Knufia obscura]